MWDLQKINTGSIRTLIWGSDGKKYRIFSDPDLVKKIEYSIFLNPDLPEKNTESEESWGEKTYGIFNCKNNKGYLSVIFHFS